MARPGTAGFVGRGSPLLQDIYRGRYILLSHMVAETETDLARQIFKYAFGST